MKSKLALSLLLFSATAFAQKESVIHIKLVNTTSMNVEKRHFLDQEVNYSVFDKTDDQRRAQFLRGNTLPEDENFNVAKTDDHNYVLRLKTAMPEMVYVNYKPVYVTPGDRVSIIYTQNGPQMSTYEDVITAKGHNSDNYEFSGYSHSKALDSSYPRSGLPKYKTDAKLYYRDLEGYYTKSSHYYDTLSNAKRYDQNLVKYLKRSVKQDFIFKLISYENELIYQNRLADAKTIGGLLDRDFVALEIVPTDSSLNFVMENLLKKYFVRLVSTKYNQLKTAGDCQSFIEYVSKYDNTYVKDYFLYFLIANYAAKVKVYSPDFMAAFKPMVTNPRILIELEKLSI